MSPSASRKHFRPNACRSPPPRSRFWWVASPHPRLPKPQTQVSPATLPLCHSLASSSSASPAGVTSRLRLESVPVCLRHVPRPAPGHAPLSPGPECHSQRLFAFDPKIHSWRNSRLHLLTLRIRACLLPPRSPPVPSRDVWNKMQTTLLARVTRRALRAPATRPPGLPWFSSRTRTLAPLLSQPGALAPPLLHTSGLAAIAVLAEIHLFRGEASPPGPRPAGATPEGSAASCSIAACHQRELVCHSLTVLLPLTPRRPHGSRGFIHRWRLLLREVPGSCPACA